MNVVHTLTHKQLLRWAMLMLLSFIPAMTQAQVTWTSANEGLTGGFVRLLAPLPDGSMLADAPDGLSKYYDGRWHRLPNSVYALSFTVTSNGTILAAGAYAGDRSYRSTDGGRSWSRLWDSLSPRFFVTANDVILSPTSGAFYRSTDEGLTWTRTRTADTSTYRFTGGIASDASGSLYATTDHGLYESIDFGDSWRHIGFADSITDVTVTRSGTFLISRSYGNGHIMMWRSSDRGVTWTTIDSGSYPKSPILESPNGSLFRMKWGYSPLDSFSGFYRSTDDGVSWRRIAKSMFTTLFSNPYAIDRDGTLWIGGGSQTLRSTTNGDSWEDISATMHNAQVRSLIADSSGGVYAVLPSSVDDDRLNPPLGGTWWSSLQSLYRTTNDGQSWTSLGDTFLYVDPVVTSAGVLIAITVGSDTNGRNTPLMSTDQGATWRAITTTGKRSLQFSIWMNDNDGVVMATEKELTVSTDGGFTWREQSLDFYPAVSVITNRNVILSLVFDSNFNYSLRRSTDLGATWQVMPDSIIGYIARTPDDNILMNDGNSSQLFRSTDEGDSWSLVYSGSIGAITIVGNTMFASDNSHLLRSTDDGKSWVMLSKDMRGIIATGDRLYGNFNAIMYYSTDNGGSWRPVNDTVPSLRTAALVVSSHGKLFAGTNGYGVYRADGFSETPLPQLHTDASALDVYTASSQLDMMTVRFTQQQTDHVTIMLHDLLGRTVATLADDVMNTGEHRLLFDASALPRGVYLLAMQSNGKRVTKKIIIE